jgi:hypothetical protein
MQCLTASTAIIAFHTLLVDYVVDFTWLVLVPILACCVGVLWICQLLFLIAHPGPAKPGIGWGLFPAPFLLALYWIFSQNRAAVPLGFWLSRYALEKAATKPGSTGDFAGSLSFAGLYPVRYVQHSGRNVRIIVAHEDFIDSHYAGFAKCPVGCGANNFKLPPGDTGYPDPTTYLHLKDDWYWFTQQGNFH